MNIFTNAITTLTTIQNSTLGQGAINMANDAGTFLATLGPAIAAAAGVYSFIRRSLADEQDAKSWDKRIRIAIGCAVACLLVGNMISILSGYFIPTTTAAVIS